MEHSHKITCSRIRTMNGIIYLKIEKGLVEFLENVVESFGFEWYELEEYKEHCPEVFITESDDMCLIVIGKHVILKFNPANFKKVSEILNRFISFQKQKEK